MFTKSYLNKVNYQSDSQIIGLAGGINNVYPSEFIGETEAQEMYNFCLDSYPAMQTKVGRTMLRNPRYFWRTDKLFWSRGLKLFILYSKWSA